MLVKASAGGGGRGMRVVEKESDLESAVEGAKREAGNSFGDDTVFLEKWLRTKCLKINDFVQIRPGGLWTKLAIFNDFVQRNRVF